MSLIKCDNCGALIDTDEHPEAYDYGLNERTGEDKWWCWSCFPDCADPDPLPYGGPLQTRNIPE